MLDGKELAAFSAAATPVAVDLLIVELYGMGGSNGGQGDREYEETVHRGWRSLGCGLFKMRAVIDFGTH